MSTTSMESALEEMKQRFPEARSGDLLGYLHIRNGSVEEASTQYKSTNAWRKAFKTPTILDCAPFLRIPEGNSGPDGCVVCLEDMKGDCARDLRGRPIVASIGMLHGSAKEMQSQMVYATNRALLYAQKGELEAQCSVVEVVPRQGANATFRFPDSAVRTVLDLQRHHYPGSAVASTTHFCGLPRAVTWGFALCKPFMQKETYENMVLKPDFSHLKKYIEPENILTEWGGELEFDLEEYVAWRAREEGVSLDETHEPRRYDAYATPGIPDDTLVGGNPLAGVSSASLQEMGVELSKMGIVQKRGSGVGLFASYKWKEKLMASVGGFLIYFNTSEVSEKNLVDKLIPLQEGSYVHEVDDVESPINGSDRVFCLVTPARSYHFSVAQEEECLEWIKVITGEIEAAVQLDLK